MCITLHFALMKGRSHSFDQLSNAPMAPFALLSAGMSAGIRDVTRYDKTFDAPFDSDVARWDWS